MSEAKTYTQQELDAAVKAAAQEVREGMQLAIGTIKAQREQANDQVVDLNVAAQTAQKKVQELEAQLEAVTKERDDMLEAGNAKQAAPKKKAAAA